MAEGAESRWQVGWLAGSEGKGGLPRGEKAEESRPADSLACALDASEECYALPVLPTCLVGKYRSCTLQEVRYAPGSADVPVAVGRQGGAHFER